MSRYNCVFSYYFKDEKTADVVIKNGKVATTPYTGDKLHLPFGFVSDRNVTRQTIDLFFERHCVPQHRANLCDFLDHYGLERYDAYEICRITNGQMADNHGRIAWHDAV
jgi:hypothetical protein